MVEREQQHRGLGIWAWVWTVAVVLSVLGLVFPLYVLDQLWLADEAWLAVTPPLIFVPFVVVALTASQQPGRAASVAAVTAGVGVVVLGVTMQRLLAWPVTLEGNWYRGPGGYAETDYPWHAYQAMALVYAAGGLLLLALLVVALARVRQRRSRRVLGPAGPKVGREDVESA